MSHQVFIELINSLGQTLLMVGLAGFIAVVFGLPLGIILFTTRRGGVLENIFINSILTTLVNATRSIPFIILLVALVPITRFIVGTSIGTMAAVVPLCIGAIPFIGRLIEGALSEIPQGLIEAGHALGASPLQIICKILIPESLPSIINNITITLVTLVGYSAMAGAVGGGGLGDLAIRYGYQRFDLTVMVVTIAILILLVQVLQFAGEYLVNKFSHRN